MCTGLCRNLQERQDTVEVEGSFLENLWAGCVAAVFLYNYDKMPVLEKYYLLGNLYFLIHYWKGSYMKKKNPISSTKKNRTLALGFAKILHGLL